MSDLNVLMLHEDVEEGRRILDLLDWTALGMKPTVCVKSGDQAMEYILRHEVNILLADVGAVSGGELLIDTLAKSRRDLLIIVIAFPPKMENVLLAMRHESVYDFVNIPLHPQEITDVLKSAGQFFGNWNLSLAIKRQTDMKEWDASPEKRKTIDRLIKDILKAVSVGDVEKMSADTTALFLKEVCPPDDQNMALGQAVAVELLAQLKYMMVNLDKEYQNEFVLYSFFHKVCQTQNGADLEDLCLGYLYRCASVAAPSQSQRQVSALVKTALQITNEKYCDSSFTLVSLADEIGISPNYLSSIFKMETGMRFKKYLNTYRIDKAKELLLDGRYKIYEVSDLVGIEDSRYFSQIFKTYIGMKPSDYRNSQIISSTEEKTNE